MAKISVHRTECCGLRIIRGTDHKNIKKQLLYICAQMYCGIYNCAFAMFSDNTKDGQNGNAMKEFIIENKLGIIKESLSDNTKTWIWEINHRNAKSWFLKNR